MTTTPTTNSELGTVNGACDKPLYLELGVVCSLCKTLPAIPEMGVRAQLLQHCLSRQMTFRAQFLYVWCAVARQEAEGPICIQKAMPVYEQAIPCAEPATEHTVHQLPSAHGVDQRQFKQTRKK